MNKQPARSLTDACISCFLVMGANIGDPNQGERTMEGRMQSMAAKAVDEPQILAHLTEGQTREVLAKLLPVAVAAIAKWVSYGQVDQIARQRAAGDRLLDAKEVAARLGCSMATLTRGWKLGRYPFILK